MPNAVMSQRNRLRAAFFGVLLVSVVVLVTGNTAQAQTGLSGIDVSNWQRQIDWVAVAGTGNSFVFAKATESTNFTDLTFPLNRSGSTVLGMRFGAYHMGRPTGATDSAVVASAIAQADYFLSVATPLKGELLPVLDVEYDGGLSVATTLALGADLARPGRRPHRPQADRLRLAELLEDEAGRFAGGCCCGPPTLDRPLDEGCAADPSRRELGGLGWSFWQWSNCQKIAGISGCVDGDRFNGSSLASVTVPGYPIGSPSLATTPTIVGSPQAGKLLAAVPGTWAGGKPIAFAYQWQRCDAAGRACSAIPAATAPTYTPTAADVGHALARSRERGGASARHRTPRPQRSRWRRRARRPAPHRKPRSSP